MGSIPVSVVIAAHNESRVIDRCLDTLLGSGDSDGLDITVVANGCHDDTAARARAHPGVRVIELAAPSKVAALNLGDSQARGFPRLYLDADIELTPRDVGLLAAALGDGVLASAPRRRVDTDGRPWSVRSYYAVSHALGAFDGRLFGRGAVMLSAQGRARFTHFPPVLSDDLFLDQLFGVEEKCQVDAVTATVAAPFSTGALTRRLVRVKAGNASLPGIPSRHGPRGALKRVGAGIAVAWREPKLGPACVAYGCLTGYAELRARVRGNRVPWGQDRSTRGLQAAQV